MVGAFQKIGEYRKLASSLGGSSVVCRSVLFLRLLSVPLRKKIFGRKPRGLSLCFNGLTFSVFVRDGADIAVLYEMFVEREYEFKLSQNPRAILDIGSHIGFSAIFFTSQYPDARISCYEPDPENFSLLLKNTVQFKNISCTNAALAASSGEASLHKASQSSISGSIVARTGDSGAKATVKTIGIDEAIATASPDLIKFDVEGAEYEIFSASRNLARVSMLIGEVHLDLMGKTEEEFRRLFHAFDLSTVKISATRSIMKALKK